MESNTRETKTEKSGQWSGPMLWMMKHINKSHSRNPFTELSSVPAWSRAEEFATISLNEFRNGIRRRPANPSSEPTKSDTNEKYDIHREFNKFEKKLVGN